MASIKLNFARLSVQDKLATTRRIITTMGGDARFVTPRPPLQSISQLTGELEEAENNVQAARQDAKAKTTIRNNREDDLDAAVATLVAYVTSMAGGDEELIEAAGMTVRNAPGTSTTPAQPAALSATAGDNDGTMDLSWDPVVAATSYVIEASPDPPTATSWGHHGVSTKSTFTVTGLTSGTRLWFRVAAVNPNGQSPWSDPATKIVP